MRLLPPVPRRLLWLAFHVLARLAGAAAWRALATLGLLTAPAFVAPATAEPALTSAFGIAFGDQVHGGTAGFTRPPGTHGAFNFSPSDADVIATLGTTDLPGGPFQQFWVLTTLRASRVYWVSAKRPSGFDTCRDERAQLMALIQARHPGGELVDVGNDIQQDWVLPGSTFRIGCYDWPIYQQAELQLSVIDRTLEARFHEELAGPFPAHPQR